MSNCHHDGEAFGLHIFIYLLYYAFRRFSIHHQTHSEVTHHFLQQTLLISQQQQTYRDRQIIIIIEYINSNEMYSLLQEKKKKKKEEVWGWGMYEEKAYNLSEKKKLPQILFVKSLNCLPFFSPFSLQLIMIIVNSLY